MQSLISVGMEAYANRTMDKMSDGECQRVMIARALAQDTPIILLDEPTSFLDMPNRYELVLSEKRFRIKIKWRTPPTFTVIGTLFAKFKKMWFVTEFGDVSFNSDV